MQYVGKVGGYMYNQWNSLNPATLSGAIDIIVVEQPDGSLHCSPWHVRFGKFQIIKPSQKKIDLYVNDIKTDLPMKLGEGGEAFFVFETENTQDLSQSVLTSPVISPVSSPGGSQGGSPLGSPRDSPQPSPSTNSLGEDLDALDLNADIESKIDLSPKTPGTSSASPAPTLSSRKLAFEKARKITKKLNISSKIDINGDMVLDMDGYKTNAQKNIDNSDEFFKKIFFQEIQELNKNANQMAENAGDDQENLDEIKLWDQIISKDENGNIRIKNKDPSVHMGSDLTLNEDSVTPTPEPLNDLYEPLKHDTDSTSDLRNDTDTNTPNRTDSDKTYFKTLRLTSEQLQKMNLHYGENTLKFKSAEGTSQVLSNLYLWKFHTPIVISDIDGTITKSDALGHVLNLFGRDWTHPGVANLFQDISFNGYNIVYVTARSVGQADTTRQYLRGISQDGGIKLPKGPVILSPDRTMAALKREIVLKKPEVFKMACLNDIKSLYFNKALQNRLDFDDLTPFYAGFGNRITDAISYRSVKIPSHRIFTINPNGEVHMELLELAGYCSSYLHIGELVDHFFPPIKEVFSLDTYWNNNQLNAYMNHKKDQDENSANYDESLPLDEHESPRSPGSLGSPRSPRSPGSPRPGEGQFQEVLRADEKYNDVNYWREPINFSDLSDEEDDEAPPGPPEVPSGSLKLASAAHSNAEPASSGLLSLLGSDSLTSDTNHVKDLADQDQERGRSKSSASSINERPVSMSSFTSPLKNFMMFGSKTQDEDEDEEDDQEHGLTSKLLKKEGLNSSEYPEDHDWADPDASLATNDSDFTAGEEEDDDVDEEDDDDYTDADEENDDYDEDDDDYDYDEDLDEDDEEDLDYGDDAIPEELKQSIVAPKLNQIHSVHHKKEPQTP